MVNPLFEDELYLLGGRALLLRGYQLDFIKEFGIQTHGEAGVSLWGVRVEFRHGLIPPECHLDIIIMTNNKKRKSLY